MWRNYLTVGIRSLIKNKTYAFINIFGLAIGLAACLMLLIYVRYEGSYDRWLPNSENIYQVQNYWTNPDTGEVNRGQMSAYVAGEALKKDYPQIEGHVHALAAAPVAMIAGEALPVENAAMVNGPFFDVLQLPMLSGDPASALARPGSVVLSTSEARRFFGNENPLGKTLTLVMRGESVDHRVTGVIRDLAKNSHMRFNMLIRYDPPSWFAESPDFMTQWGNISGWHYVALKAGTDVEAIRADLPNWERRNIPDQTFGDQAVNQGDIADWDLVNVRDVHLGEAQGGAMAPGNDARTIITFTIIALLILGMACVNFTNLATARASQRAREVALRKVLGASRRQLMIQFLVESVLVAGVAMLLALSMAEMALPFLSTFLDADLRMSYWGADGMLLPILLLVLLVGAAGGIYPAIYLSRFQPAQVLKANKSSPEASGSGRLRNVLVVAQFAVSIGLIICTAIVYNQTVHARTIDPGFQREGLLQVGGLNRRQVAPLSEALAREVARLDGVVSVGRTGLGIATGNFSVFGMAVPGRTEPVGMHSYAIDEGFMETMGMELLGGRLLDADRPADDSTLPFPTDLEAERALVARGANVVLNELGARRLGYQNPADAVGQQYRMFMVSPEAGGLAPVTIVGVVKDARLRSIREPLDPIAFRLSDVGLSHMVVRYETADPAALRERIGDIWKRFAADAPYDAEFSEEIVAELYGAEGARAQTFAGFAGLSVVVACLGLFGLAAFTAERRTKEIGIRKVLGARSGDIVQLLAWQFSKPVIIANLIAWPVAWWLMRDWLNTFDARIDLGPGPFLLAGLLALAIAVGTIAGHAMKVARANPIHALRYE
jgi:putative ABC transport system permease protein